MKLILALSVIIAVLGTYICGSTTGKVRWIGAGMIIAGITALLLYILDYKHRENHIKSSMSR